MNKIFDAGCDAVHAAGKDILAAIHFTNPEKEGLLMDYASKLADYDSDGDGVKEGVSYDVFASSYYPKGAGVAVITVKAAATENYKAASKKITITVKPKKVSGIKVKPANKQITASWKKTAKADGYKVQYSTAKSFKNAKEVTTTGTSGSVKGLKSKTTYYVRVCAYVKNGNKKIDGAYGKTIKVTVK